MTVRPRELQEIYDQALYDKAHLGPGGPVDELVFFNRSVGSGVRLIRGGSARDVSASFGDTNTYIAGTVAPGHQAVVGIVHRLHAHPWHQTRAEVWWLSAAQGAYVDLRVVDRIYLTLPLTSLPLLGAFASPFARAVELVEDYDAAGNLTGRYERTWLLAQHWRIEPRVVIQYPQSFAVTVRFPSPVQPPLEFDVEVMLLGMRQRGAA